MDQAEQTVMRDEYEIHGNDIAVKITTIDTMAGNAIRSGSDIGEIRYSLSLPEKIAGQTYSIEFSNTTNDIVFASEDRDETRVKIPFSTEDTTVLPTTLYSSKSEYSIVYNPDARTIEIS
jgi:spore germination protein YaaH